MTSNQFFITRLEEDASLAVLEGDEHRHLSRVARVKEGEPVWLFDAGGTRYFARVDSIEPGRTKLRIIRREQTAGPAMKLVLVQAVVAAKKMEFILQKAAELGVSDFQPVETARSLRMPDERSGRKIDRWIKIAREAVKQSKGSAVPAVHPALSLKAFLKRRGDSAVRVFLSEHGGRSFGSLFVSGECQLAPRPSSVVLCIGPEGGWTDAEERLMADAGFEAVSLGNRILRSETAAVAAAAMISHFWNV